MMDPEDIKSKIITNVSHIIADKKVALHKHIQHDELFYCMKGSGFGVLADREVELTPGVVFNVPSGMLHPLIIDNDLWVGSFLIPVIL